ncbi:MAG: flagellar motor protein MotB [Rhodospirillales bacterium]|jgi:chemotaxis protein MotB|nr:flagellar motor protein MotB [Rhodospirillales bacterium]MBT4628117.1 flagellar motor protein MotB [Rhodospirillales bacterium]MBT5350142.1 flagellar motor protein MotB [Rhodospirillales bacterium]MBT5521008.1 flagellar motor protein MotB [Rhodospirillales bacterium]MBT6825830.1 flagellar motor protein MotB [Rhodospirillales bacterium]
MAEGAPQSIIIKKVKKGGHAAHHGGAWKIAYADFVTAMMAFFLLLWLLNAVPQESLEGISNYFAPVSVSESTSGSGGVLGGKVMSEEEAGISESSSSVTMDLPPPSAGSGGDDQASAEDIAEDAAREAMEALEQQQFDEAQQKIIQAIEADETLSQLKDSLKMDDTPEGLRIQLLDQDGLPMFQSGGATMLAHTRKVMALVAKVIKNMPQQISISGHTDSVPFSDDHGYSNWELSSDRANSARRELMDDGVPYERVSQVIGKASTEPLMEDNPTHPSNRRLSIVLLRGSAGPLDAEEEILPGLSDIKQKQLEDTLNSIE